MTREPEGTLQAYLTNNSRLALGEFSTRPNRPRVNPKVSAKRRVAAMPMVIGDLGPEFTKRRFIPPWNNESTGGHGTVYLALSAVTTRSWRNRQRDNTSVRDFARDDVDADRFARIETIGFHFQVISAG